MLSHPLRAKYIILASIGVLALLVLAALLLLPRLAKAGGTVYYVDIGSVGGTCSDTANSGQSPSSPFCSFTKAHSVASAGDTVYFRHGVYPPMLITKSGTSGAYLKFASYPHEIAIVDAAGTDWGIRTTNTKYVEINGFEVKNAGGDSYAGIYIKGQPVTGTDFAATQSGYNRIINNIVHDNHSGSHYVAGIELSNSSYNVVQGNNSFNNYYSGIVSEAATDVTEVGNEFIGNVSYNNTGSGGDSDGISVQGNRNTRSLIQGNIFYGNSDDGIDTWTSSGNIIEHNLVYNQKGPGDGNGIKAGGSITGGSDTVRYNMSYGNKANGFDSNGSGGNQYYNNVAYNNGGYGFEDGWRNAAATGCSPESARCYTTLKNNIGMNNGTGNLSAGVMTKTSDYNLWFSSGKAKVLFNYVNYDSLSGFTAASGMSLDAHSLSADPLFVSAGSGEFHLQATSPAINAGTSVGINADYSGSVVPQGSGTDIGLFEMTPVVVITPPPSTPTPPAPNPQTPPPSQNPAPTATSPSTAPATGSDSAPATSDSQPAAGSPAAQFTVTIHVIDEGNKPILGAKLTLHSQEMIAYTDANGLATFANVEPGQHTVIADYNGSEATSEINVSSSVNSFDVSLNSNPTLTPAAAVVNAVTSPYLQIICATLILLAVLSAVIIVVRRRRLKHATGSTQVG